MIFGMKWLWRFDFVSHLYVRRILSSRIFFCIYRCILEPFMSRYLHVYEYMCKFGSSFEYGSFSMLPVHLAMIRVFHVLFRSYYCSQIVKFVLTLTLTLHRSPRHWAQLFIWAVWLKTNMSPLFAWVCNTSGGIHGIFAFLTFHRE